MLASGMRVDEEGNVSPSNLNRNPVKGEENFKEALKALNVALVPQEV